MSNTVPPGDPDHAAMADALRKGKPAWARIAGFDNVVWCREEPEPVSGDWLTLLEPPTSAGRYTLCTEAPIPVPVDGTFWTLFQPAGSAFNGWLEYPHEIAVSAMVECRLLSSGAPPGSPALPWGGAQQLVEVRDVLMLRDIARRFPPDRSGQIMDGRLISPGRYGCSCASEDLRYYDYTFDDGNMWLICQVIDGREIAVLCGGWLVYDFIYAGHRPLTDAELEYLRCFLPVPWQAQ